MDRLTCVDTIAAHRPFDGEEAQSINASLAFLDEHPHFWQRHNYVGHLTASAWVVNAARSHVLLTHHRKFDRWLQLGGHIEEGDESLLAGALREAVEESGIVNIKPMQTAIFDVGHHPINTPKEPPHVHYDIRFLFLAHEMTFAVSEESHALGWFALDEIDGISHTPALQRMAQKCREQALINPSTTNPATVNPATTKPATTQR
ncbi:MAG: NUDIX hydrolase [Kaiparowitsia implicata GSE-PSE-MK54-09C]|jgi:8-oxo-dGTP pyrophosphatase MutT (NUDIX family)|nr:NUDIX hydrolase [Kaiparowitsia implicata GSE-PSE-MK54-09C]